MRDTLFELYNRCPSCGKARGLYYSMQFPLIVNRTLSGKNFIKKNGKRVTKMSNRTKAYKYDAAQIEYQVAICVCELCGWESEPLTP